MKNIDLFYAVDGADDDMLMEAEDYFRVRSHRGLRRVALIAAVVALLTMTVYGAYSRIRLRFDEKNDSYWFQDFEHEGIQYTRVTFEYDLEPVEVRTQAVDFLEDMLAPCDHWLLDGDRLIPAMNYHSHNFESLEFAENFFGVEFRLPDIVRRGEVQDREVTMDAKPMYYPEDLPRHEGYGFSYDAELGGASVWCKIGLQEQELSGVTVFVYLGLTEEFCARAYEASFFYAMDELGEPRIREKRIGDQEYTILTFPDSVDDRVTVFYVRDGVGYELNFFPAADWEGDPEAKVISFLKDMG